MTASTPRHIAVLFGGTGAEAKISCASAADVLACTEAFDTPPLAVYIAKDGIWYITDASVDCIRSGTLPEGTLTPTYPVRLKNRRGLLLGDDIIELDLVLPVLHGDGGEDGIVQGALATASLPYVGADTRCGALCCDKALCKTVAHAAGIPTLPFTVWRKEDGRATLEHTLHRIFGKHPYPLFIKPTSLGSSVGVGIAACADELHTALSAAAAYGDVLIEPYVHPLREVEIGWLDGDLPVFSEIVDIRSRGAFYDYDEKYVGKCADTHLPASLPAAIEEQLYTYAMMLPATLGLRELCRMDFFLTEDGRLYFNEVNTFPGFGRDSIYPKMMARMGIPYPALLRRLCAHAYARCL